MKTSSKFVSLAATGLMATTTLGMAQTASGATAPTTYTTQKEMLRTAADAMTAVQRTHEARLAIFNDKTDDARALVDQAIEALSDGENAFEDLMISDTGEANPTEKTFLPFDVSLAMAENFTATEENKLALQKAYGLFESAEPDDAIEVLRLASVDLQVTAAQLPAERSMKLLKEAKGFIEKGEYQQANLALKAVENSVIVRTFGIDAIPEQGTLE